MTKQLANYNDYLQVLRECVGSLALSHERTGRYNLKLQKLKEDLSHEDPFICYRASKAAIQLMRDKSIYH